MTSVYSLCHLVSPATWPSRRYTPADLLFACWREWRDHPATLQHLSFTHRLHRAQHCHPSPLLVVLHCSTQYALTPLYTDAPVPQISGNSSPRPVLTARLSKPGLSSSTSSSVFACSRKHGTPRPVTTPKRAPTPKISV